MLKIALVRATLGKSVSAKLKNDKDDQERIMEFKLSKLSLTHRQLTDLVCCHKHERPFDQVAFVSTDAMSELRHFKKMELSIEVLDAVLILDRIGTSAAKLQLKGCNLKGIHLSFTGEERIEMSCRVWAPLEEHALYTLGKWGSSDLYVAIDSPKHGAEEPSANTELALH